MSYTINWTDNGLKAPFTIIDSAFNTSDTPLTLPGRDAVTWGEHHNENMLKLLENFASLGTPPSNPTTGMTWFNASDNTYSIYFNDAWNIVSFRRADSASEPTGTHYPGDLWYDTANDVLMVYTNGGTWTAVAGDGGAVTDGTPGQIAFFAASSAPTGWVKANGALLSRTLYPNLWTHAQASGNVAVSDGSWEYGQYSPGNGSTTFRIPDLRGYFIRGWDDGRGADVGRGLGTFQADTLLSHSHTISVTDPGHSHTVVGGIAVITSDLSSLSGSAGFAGLDNNGSDANVAGYVYSETTGITASSSTEGSSAETRVSNISLLACIKY